MCAPIFMTQLKNAKNGQNAHYSIESTLLSQSPTVKDKFLLSTKSQLPHSIESKSQQKIVPKSTDMGKALVNKG